MRLCRFPFTAGTGKTVEEATRGSLGTYWHGSLNSRRDLEQSDTAYDGHPVCVYGGGGGGECKRKWDRPPAPAAILIRAKHMTNHNA